MVSAFVSKYDKQVHRFLEMVPGVLTWTFLLSPVWLGILFPQGIVYLLTFLTVYWAFLALRHAIGMIIGYQRYKEEMALDWMEECNKLDFSKLPEKETRPEILDEVRHFVLVPAVSEPYSVLKATIDAILNQTFPTKQIVLVCTVEERGAEQVVTDLKELMKARKHHLYKFFIYVHPAGIPGEAIGAGAANRTWGAKHAVEELRNSGENLRNYIFSTLDADHVMNPQYLARLTHLYLTSDRRDYKFFSTAVHLFDNNYWKVPVLMRIEATATTLGGLSDWIVEKKGTKDTFAAYSASLQTLIDADYWDVALGIDDTIFYWRAFFTRDGDFTGVPHFIPFSADAVEGTTYLNTHKSLYKQLLRWGWGVIDFPLSVKGFLKNTAVPFRAKIAWMVKHLEKRVLLINIVFLITFGFAILTLVNPNVKQTNFAYSLPKIMSLILTITLIFFVPVTIIRFKVVKPHPESWSIWRKIFSIFETPLVVINMLTFSFFPYLEAQTRMLLGKRMKDLYHTPKVRKHA